MRTCILCVGCMDNVCKRKSVTKAPHNGFCSLKINEFHEIPILKRENSFHFVFLSLRSRRPCICWSLSSRFYLWRAAWICCLKPIGPWEQRWLTAEVPLGIPVRSCKKCLPAATPGAEGWILYLMKRFFVPRRRWVPYKTPQCPHHCARTCRNFSLLFPLIASSAILSFTLTINRTCPHAPSAIPHASLVTSTFRYDATSPRFRLIKLSSFNPSPPLA